MVILGKTPYFSEYAYGFVVINWIMVRCNSSVSIMYRINVKKGGKQIPLTLI